MFWKNRNLVTKSLKLYDFVVNDINCNYVWRCNKQNIVNNYTKNIGKIHGTGYFLKNNYSLQKLYLMDINDDTLNFTKNNLQDKSKNIKIAKLINHNIFENKIEFKKLDSVCLNYVLHCVPGRLEEKVDNLVNNLIVNNQVKYFGATVLSNKYLQTPLSNCQLYFLNEFKIFNNTNDDYQNLIKYFQYNKIKYQYKIIGNVLIFSFVK